MLHQPMVPLDVVTNPSPVLKALGSRRGQHIGLGVQTPLPQPSSQSVPVRAVFGGTQVLGKGLL